MKTQSLAVLALLALTGGCARPGDDRIEVRYMAWGNPQQLALEQRICDQFNAKQSRIRARLFQVPQSAYGNKMLVMLATGTAPDVMRVDHYNFPRLVKRDYFRQLDDLIAADSKFDRRDFFPQTLEEGTYNGKLYGLNVLFGAPILYYNKTMVKAAGLEDPFELWKKGKWTWSRFLDHAKKMTVKDSKGVFRQFGAAIPGSPINFSTLYSMGAEIMDPTWTKVRAGEGRAVAAWQFWHDLRFKHHAAPTPAQAANSVFSFESGKLGMTLDWMGVTPRLREAATHFEWDVAPMPSGDGGSVSTVKGNQLVMDVNCQHPKAAWEFMTYLTGPEVERLLAVEMRRTFPTRKSIAYSDEYLKSDKPPYNMRTFTFTIENGKVYPITSRWNDWLGEFNSGLDNLFNGQTHDVAAAAREAQDRAQRALEIKEGL